MNLKEAFRYQNHLDRLFDDACSYLSDEDYIYKTDKIHNRSKVNPEHQDFTESVGPKPLAEYDRIVEFATQLIQEKEKLTSAVNKAKADCEIDIDSLVESNKMRHRTQELLKRVLMHKTSVSTVKGSDYKFNSEGNQIEYVYDVVIFKENSFSREKIRKILKTVTKIAEEASAEIDCALINVKVDYTPIFDVNESFAEIIENC